jgi:hypothetical protein
VVQGFLDFLVAVNVWTNFVRAKKKMHSFVKKRVHLSEKTTCGFYENDVSFF